MTGSSDGTAQGERERVRLRPPARGGRSVNYARRQQYRRLSHAGKAGLGSVIAALFGLVIASAGAAALAGLLLLTAVGLGLYARHWLSLAGRSRVGARSEDEVQRALAPLQAEGWRLRHSLTVAGSGRHRLGGDRARPGSPSRSKRRRGRTTPPSRSGARAGGVAVTAPAKMGTQRRAWRRVPRSRAGRRARRARRGRGLDRPVDPCPSRRGGDGSRRLLRRLAADPPERASTRLYPGRA